MITKHTISPKRNQGLKVLDRTSCSADRASELDIFGLQFTKCSLVMPDNRPIEEQTLCISGAPGQTRTAAHGLGNQCECSVAIRDAFCSKTYKRFRAFWSAGAFKRPEAAVHSNVHSWVISLHGHRTTFVTPSASSVVIARSRPLLLVVPTRSRHLVASCSHRTDSWGIIFVGHKSCLDTLASLFDFRNNCFGKSKSSRSSDMFRGDKSSGRQSTSISDAESFELALMKAIEGLDETLGKGSERCH